MGNGGHLLLRRAQRPLYVARKNRVIDSQSAHEGQHNVECDLESVELIFSKIWLKMQGDFRRAGGSVHQSISLEKHAVVASG